jgi:predicted Fe-Mo cluster-binding NifX family protein
MHVDALRIAVSSQDRKTITSHAGRCRKFWVYEIRGNKVENKTLRELTPEQTLYSSPLNDDYPFDDVHVMITAGMSPFLYQRLQQGGIKPFVTEETDPDRAVRMLLEKVAQA